MEPELLINRVAEMARSQHGLVRLEQFPEAERGRVRHLARKGILQRVGRGVFRVSGSPTTWMQSLQAGIWALGAQAAVSHGAAARLYGCDRFEAASAELSVPRLQRGRSLGDLAVVVHTTTSPLRGDIRHVDGLPITSPERTIVDLARSGTSPKLLEAAIDSMIRLRLTTLDHITDRIAQCQGSSRWGVAQLDALVLTSGGHSVLERRFLRLMHDAGLPTPTPQVVHRKDGRHVARVDFLFPELGLVVEVSGGRGHSSASDRAKDARRRNALQQAGRTVLEFTYEHVMGREDYVLNTLEASGVSRK